LLQDEDVLTLNRAGLTVLQAKIYLSLLKNGKQTIKSISELASVDRANTYREVLKLQKIALIKKIIDTPSFYEAIPLEDGIPLLLANKEEEYKTTKKETDRLMEKFKASPSGSLEKVSDDFVLIPKKNAFMQSAMQNIQAAQISNYTISSMNRFSQALVYTFELHKDALKKGVRIKVIVEKPKAGKPLNKAISDLMAYPNFELRYVASPPEVLGACFDSKKVAVLLYPSANVQDSPCLTTHHQSLVKLFLNYFDDLWHSAAPMLLADYEN
jgi:sugar-specific transcriptional regulator TrmB